MSENELKKKSHKPRFGAFLSLLLALCFITVSVSPAVQPAKATSFVDVAAQTFAPISPMKIQIWMQAFLSLFGGANYGLNGEAQEVLARNNAADIQKMVNLTSAFAYSLASGQGNISLETSTFQAMKAQAAAQDLYDYQKQNGLDYQYDADYVFSHCEAANDSLEYLWLILGQMNQIMSAYTSYSQTFAGTYADMSWGMAAESAYGANSVLIAASGYSSKAYRNVAFVTTIETESGKYVWMPNGTSLMFVNPTTSAINTTIVVSNPDGTEFFNQTVDLAASDILIVNGGANMTTGRYNVAISNSGVMCFGTAMPDQLTSTTVYPAVISYYKDGTAAKCDFVAICDSNGQLTNAVGSGKTGSVAWWPGKTSLSIYFKTAADSTVSGNLLGVPDDQTVRLTDPVTVYASDGTSHSVSLMAEIAAIIQSTNRLMSDSNAFAQAYYQALVASNGQLEGMPTPIWDWGDPAQYENMTWQEIMAVYYTQLNAMKDRFANYSYMTPANINFSASSFNLLCRGAIYDENGKMLYDAQSVWTPYITLSDYDLVIGNNTMNQPGFILVWNRGVSDLANVKESDPSTMAYVDIKRGYTLSIEQMYYEGEAVTNHTLVITKLETVVGSGGTADGGAQVQTPDLGWFLGQYWWLLCGIMGVILLVGGIAVKQQYVILIGGILLVVCVAGYLMHDQSVKLFGIFQLENLPQNMTDWLTQIRGRL